MKKFINSTIGIIAAIVLLLGTSCVKEDEILLPELSFSNQAGFISENSMAQYGDTLHFGVSAKSNGSDNLVKFQIFLNNTIAMDTTINTTVFTTNFSSIKGSTDKDTWTFVITDIAGNVKRDSLIITGNFGEILNYSNIQLGAQNNASTESFLSLSNSTASLYFQAAAYEHQSEIDMFCFYEETATVVNKMALAAPGSNINGIFTGSTAPDNYTVKNVTFFVKTSLSGSDFDAVKNDGIILASFDPSKKYKKAKLLAANDVYAFKLQSGKMGLFKVIAVDGKEAGSLQIALKVQK